MNARPSDFVPTQDIYKAAFLSRRRLGTQAAKIDHLRIKVVDFKAERLEKNNAIAALTAKNAKLEKQVDHLTRAIDAARVKAERVKVNQEGQAIYTADLRAQVTQLTAENLQLKREVAVSRAYEAIDANRAVRAPQVSA